MTKKTRNWLLALFILAFPFVVFSGFLLSDFLALPPIPPLPNPNGYDDLVKAGEMVTDDAVNFDKMNEQELQTFVENNSNALFLARSGLQLKCRVPLDYSATSGAHLHKLSAIKILALAFVAEGKLAEMENRPNDAVKSYLDTFHLGDESARGGVLIDGLVGIAVEAIGTSNLQKLAGQLDSKSCRETAAALETLDAQRQTLDEVMQQENNWSHRTFAGIRNEIARLMTRKSLLPALAATGRKYMEQQIRTRKLLIDLAARAYELDKGKPPANVADLVPDYLKAIPQDPLTGTNMVYSPK